jgi:hypothetical protein
MPKRALLLLASISLAGVAHAAPPAGYKCGDGKPLLGVGCQCPSGNISAVDKDNNAICVTARPEPIVARTVPERSSKLATMIMTEIVALEKQLATTKPSSDQHVILCRRLAESYRDLETTERSQYEAAGASNEDKTKAAALVSKCRDRVVYLYQLILDKHDDYPKLDEVLYFQGYEYETFDALDAPDEQAALKEKRESREKALAKYLELIKKAPKSLLVTDAYTAFGDLYFEEALDGRVEWKIPLEAYERVIESGDPPDNRLWGYAQYRKGFVYWNLHQNADAASALKKAKNWSTKYPDGPKATEIGAAATKALGALS